MGLHCPHFPILPLLLFVVSISTPLHATTPSNILVILDDDDLSTTHSRFIHSLSRFHHTLEIKSAAKTASFPLIQDGDYIYSSIILLCPTAPNMQRKLPLSSLLQFVDAGHSLFLSSSPRFSDYTEKVAESIGIDLDSSLTELVDHQYVDDELDDGSRTFIRAGGVTPSAFLFGSAPLAASDIVFKGPGATLFKDNELVDSVIWGSGSCYSTRGRKTLSRVPRVVGTACVMAVALSTRVGGRAAYFGGIEALADKVLEKRERHAEAVTRLLAWSVGEAGVVQVGKIRYWVVGGEGREEVRVKDVVRLEVDVKVWDGEEGIWKALVVDDMQVEFVMLNPWVRKRLRCLGNENGTYAAEIQVPDQIGVYKFRIEYWRAGIGGVVVQEVVPVRPYLHNEYERFIGMATPYYAGAFSMLIGVFLMALVTLHGGAAGDNHVKED